MIKTEQNDHKKEEQHNDVIWDKNMNDMIDDMTILMENEQVPFDDDDDVKEQMLEKEEYDENIKDDKKQNEEEKKCI